MKLFLLKVLAKQSGDYLPQDGLGWPAGDHSNTTMDVTVLGEVVDIPKREKYLALKDYESILNRAKREAS